MMSEFGTVSEFWQGVPGHPSILIPPDVGCLDKQSINTVLNDNSLSFAFRSNREVIDLFGRFRRCKSGGDFFFLKPIDLQSGREEVVAFSVARERLSKIKHTSGIQVSAPEIRLIELDNGRGVLATEDFGQTLHSSERCRSEPLNRLVRDLPALLNANGISWPGFAPRNLLGGLEGAPLMLIDWEGARFFDGPTASSGSLFSNFKTALDWSDDSKFSLLYRKAFFEKLDSSLLVAGSFALEPFESILKRTYYPEASSSWLRIYCMTMFVEWNRPTIENSPITITPSELSHLIRDLFDIQTQQLFMIMNVTSRAKFGEARYTKFLTAVGTALQECLGELEAGSNLTVCLNPIRDLLVRTSAEFWTMGEVASPRDVSSCGMIDATHLASAFDAAIDVVNIVLEDSAPSQRLEKTKRAKIAPLHYR